MSISKAGLYIKNIMGVSKEVSTIPWFFVKNHGLRLLSLRSSRFLSFFRLRGDRTSERKAGERRSTPGVRQKIGEE